MPGPFYDTSEPNVGLRALTGASNASDIDLGFLSLAQDIGRLIDSQDVMQAGVVGSGDGVFSPNAVSSSTGAMSAPSTTGGKAWVATVAGLLVRGAIPTAPGALTPASLPASSKSASYGIDLVPGAAGVAHTIVLTAKSSDQTTAGAALAAPLAPISGHTRIANIILSNSGGTITLPQIQDVRTWSGIGAWVPLTLATNVIALSGGYTPAARLERGGVVRLRGGLNNNTGGAVSPGTTLATIPSSPPGLLPLASGGINVPAINIAGTAGVAQITSSGLIVFSASIPNTQTLGLDGITFSTT